MAAILNGILTFFELLNNYLKLKLIKFKLDLDEEIDQKYDAAKENMDKLKASGDPNADAKSDRLRKQITQRALFSSYVNTVVSIPTEGNNSSN